MRRLAKLTALLTVILVLAAPIDALADSGIDVANYSDGSITISGATCSWADLLVNAFPPDSVTVPGLAIGCPYGTSVGDLVFYFDAGGATLQSLDVIRGMPSFFWCRYVASNLRLSRTDNGSDPNRHDYAGGATIPLHSSNWPEQCANPASVSVQVTFRQVP